MYRVKNTALGSFTNGINGALNNGLTNSIYNSSPTSVPSRVRNTNPMLVQSTNIPPTSERHVALPTETTSQLATNSNECPLDFWENFSMDLRDDDLFAFLDSNE